MLNLLGAVGFQQNLSFAVREGLCCTNGKGLRVSVKCRDDDLYPSEISHHELANLQCSFEISGLTDALDRQRDVLAG